VHCSRWEMNQLRPVSVAHDDVTAFRAGNNIIPQQHCARSTKGDVSGCAIGSTSASATVSARPHDHVTCSRTALRRRADMGTVAQGRAERGGRSAEKHRVKQSKGELDMVKYHSNRWE
jgi:hypothetical protein